MMKKTTKEYISSVTIAILSIPVAGLIFYGALRFGIWLAGII